MEDSNYFLKGIGLESYMDHEKPFCDDPLTRDDMENLEYSSLTYGSSGGRREMNKSVEENGKILMGDKDDVSDKLEQGINEEVNQIMSKVEADDFFSSLELQSSSKMSSGVSSLGFQSKPTSGILTRSRSLVSASHDALKSGGKNEQKIKNNKILKVKRVAPKSKKKARKSERKKIEKNKRVRSESLESKKLSNQQQQQQSAGKLLENILIDKRKEEDDWMFLQQLGTKKEVSDDKLFENKPLLGNDLSNHPRRSTPELFSMSPILMNEVMPGEKDEVDKLLESDYDDSFLEEDMEEYGNAPPRSHTGGKWKPGTLLVRTSPIMWETFLDERNDEEGSKMRSETPIEAIMDSKCSTSTSSGGKWTSLVPPITHTGGKWKPAEVGQRAKRPEEIVMADDGEHFQPMSGPPLNHTGGKWKPCSTPSNIFGETSKLKSNMLLANSTSGKWSANSGKTSYSRSTLDIVATCQSTSGKCLKTSGGVIQYYCSPCNRRLSSKKLYRKHVQSELHLKRVLQENDLEFDSRSLKIFRGLISHVSRNERGLGKRVIKKPEAYKDANSDLFKKEKKTLSEVKIKRKKTSRKEIIRCEVCKIKISRNQLGKHLVSYYHTRRMLLNDPEQRNLILNNIDAIVRQAPYQCGLCKFYCNSHVIFKKHWTLPVHVEAERSSEERRFWCSLCNFESQTARSMELHLDSNSHREVIQAVNRSIPIIIRHKKIFRCPICFKEFRFNKETSYHKRLYHPETLTNAESRYACELCKRSCKNMKSLQEHIIMSHKDEKKVPYFCSVCDEHFETVAQAKAHRNGQKHKLKRVFADKGEKIGKSLIKSCAFCGQSLDDLEKLKAHLLENHRNLLPRCIKCGKLFALSQEVSRHEKKNECQLTVGSESDQSSARFKCQICPFATDLQSELFLHAAVVHQNKNKHDKKISCPFCNSFYTQSALGIHLRTHLKEKTYQCSMCSSTFVRKDRYVAHLKLKHFSKCEEPIADAVKLTEPVELQNAEKMDGLTEEKNGMPVLKVSDKKDAKTEVYIDKRQVCGDAKCKYVAKDAKDFENHNLIHVAPKVFQCPECPYVAKTNTIMKRHYKIHTGEKQFSCPHCTFKATFSSHLKRHLLVHTGAKPFKCPFCPYTCNIIENLRKHVLHTKLHPGKKLFRCKSCGYETNDYIDFKVHLNKSHKKKFTGAEVLFAAGIYNREEKDGDNAKIVLEKKISSRVLPPTPPSKNLKKKIEILTKKFTPIAPKAKSPVKKVVTDVNSSKFTGNSIEDKRKVLEMELEKLKKQIKPETRKIPRSYPSPADKANMTKRMAAEKNEEKKENEDENSEGMQGNLATSSEEDANFRFPPSAYVLYDSGLESQETEFYLLENYGED